MPSILKGKMEASTWWGFLVTRMQTENAIIHCFVSLSLILLFEVE